MPLTFSTFLGLRRDFSTEGGRYYFEKFNGLDAGPPNDVALSVAQSIDGYDPCNYKPLQIAAYTSKVSLMAYKFPDVMGNIFATIHNTGDNAGRIGHVHQEIWDGETPVQIPNSRITKTS